MPAAIAARVVAVDAEHRPGDLAAAGAHQPGQRHDLAGAHLEGHVVEDTGAVQPLDLEDRGADVGRGLREQVAHLAADHQRDDLVDVGLGGGPGGDVLPVAHDRDRVAEREHLVEPVRDEHQGTALVTQAACDGEQPLDLDPAQRGGRLVHDQDPGVERDGLGDLDDLLVRDREAQRLAPRVDVHPEAGEESLRLGVHRAAVDAPAGPEQLTAHEDVLGDREVGEERRLLVDHRDAGGLRLRGAREVGGLAVEQHLAGVQAVHAGHDLDQGGLAGAVLPDERVDRPALDDEGARPQREDRPEGLAHVPQLQARGARHAVLRLKGFKLERTLGDPHHRGQDLPGHEFATATLTLPAWTGPAGSCAAYSDPTVERFNEPREPRGR
jgi:hypothetical protein